MNIRQEIVKEIHKPTRRNFKRRKIIMRGFFDTLGLDLVEMIPFENQNRGFRYILAGIDHLSKYGFLVPVRRKTGADVAKALEIILKQCPAKVKNLLMDQGLEFFNKNVKKVTEKWGIKQYFVGSHMKSAICERFIRTIKGKLYPLFTLNGNGKWLNLIDGVVKDYNNTKHRVIKMAPAEVNAKNAKELLKTVYNYPKDRSRKIKFNVGDKVRVSKHKNMAFEKGYTPNYSFEIFEIDKIRLNSDPIVYLLKDRTGRPVQGSFYAEELLKTRYPDTYLIEKVLQRKKGKARVKWLGFPSSENSWIDADKIV